MNSVNKINEETAKLRNMAQDLKDMSLNSNATEEKEENDDGSSSRTRYEEALYCLTDPLLPVRGHGLIELTRLVKEKDKQTAKNIDKVIGIFRVKTLLMVLKCHSFFQTI